MAYSEQQVINERPASNPDDVLWVQFYKHPVKMEYKSEQEGRPIFEDRVMIRIQAPGDTLTVTDREAWDGDYQRFPRQWAHFQNQSAGDGIEGTPLAEWAALTRSQVEELKAIKFYTVEQVANASDTQIQRIGMGGMGLRTKALAFLQSATDTAVVQRQAAELERNKAEMDELRRQIADLAARITENEAPRRGRPPKAA